MTGKPEIKMGKTINHMGFQELILFLKLLVNVSTGMITWHLLAQHMEQAAEPLRRMCHCKWILTN